MTVYKNELARRNYMDVESNLEDLIDLFARG